MIHDDRVAAHRTLFLRRHADETSESHRQLIEAIHGPAPRIIGEAFRGFGKSTISEEALLIKAGLREFKYGVILGNTYAKAVQRLESIKSEIDKNPYIELAFGSLHGETWNESKIVLTNGVVIEAFGARQSMRGAKVGNSRPDFVLVDDLEDEEWVRNPDAIEANLRWWVMDFLPALSDPITTPIRMIGTPLAQNALLVRMAKLPDWQVVRFPVRYLDEAGVWQPTWPARFPLEKINAIEASYVSVGQHTAFMQEYMLEVESKADRVFLPEHFIYDPGRPRTWQSVYAMIDPARTTKATSAMTGWAVWSYAPGGRLVMWEMDGGFLKPDEVVDLVFRLNDDYRPVWLGVEEDGLNDWLLQPIAAAQANRGLVPVRPMKAPRGKIDFIRGLQTFFAPRLVTLAGDAPQFAAAFGQFMAFPKGLIDIPNAAAYLLLMRPGKAVYEDFALDCVFEDRQILRWATTWLALNADGHRVTAALIQDVEGVMRVLADWAMDGQAVDTVPILLREASALVRGKILLSVPPVHSERYRNVGLIQAIQRAGLRVSTGAPPAAGQPEIQRRLQQRLRGLPAFQVCADARWTLNGFSSGYAYPLLPGNIVARETAPGVYQCMIEGIESFAATASLRDDDADDRRYEYTDDGRKYLSALKRSR